MRLGHSPFVKHGLARGLEEERIFDGMGSSSSFMGCMKNYIVTGSEGQEKSVLQETAHSDRREKGNAEFNLPDICGR